ncbi:MAG: hypothetical protein WCJ39_00370 [bacterium]
MYNILAALSVSVQIGIDIEKSIATIEKFEGVDGRMQHVNHN